MKTTVINLYAGSGTGKSTLAAALFSKMKSQGYHCELVREFAKTLAWEGKNITPYDQVYIFGKQTKYESQLYGKVDYIITDSPVLLAAIYENYYTKKHIILPSVLNFLNYNQENGIKYLNFFLKRTKPYDTRGRYESIKVAKRIDKHIISALRWNKISFQKLNNNSYEESVEDILKVIESGRQEISKAKKLFREKRTT